MSKCQAGHVQGFITNSCIDKMPPQGAMSASSLPSTGMDILFCCGHFTVLAEQMGCVLLCWTLEAEAKTCLLHSSLPVVSRKVSPSCSALHTPPRAEAARCKRALSKHPSNPSSKLGSLSKGQTGCFDLLLK
ncbi:hypothetical protein ABBQ38_012580 [Trebouxia sp. C0009 RCD-2024]